MVSSESLVISLKIFFKPPIKEELVHVVKLPCCWAVVLGRSPQMISSLHSDQINKSRQTSETEVDINYYVNIKTNFIQIQTATRQPVSYKWSLQSSVV